MSEIENVIERERSDNEDRKIVSIGKIPKLYRTWKCDEIFMNYNQKMYRIPDFGALTEIDFLCAFLPTHNDQSVPSTINFVKSLDGFRAVAQEDQLRLVKDAWMELFVLRKFIASNDDGKCWRIIDCKEELREIPFDQIFLLYGCSIYDLYKKTMVEFNPKLRRERKLMILLFPLLFYCDKRENLKNPDVIRNLHLFYCDLLIDYLTELHDDEEAEQLVIQINILIKRIKKISSQMRRILASGGLLTNIMLEKASQVLLEIIEILR